MKLRYIMCAIRARELWGLWNDGYPVHRIVEHFPRGGTIILYLVNSI